MKKILISALILLCCISQSAAWMNVTTVGGGVPAAGCTAGYGSELMSSANAAEPDASDADATTGFSQNGLATFDSITDAPQLGTYHITAVANSDTDRFWYDLGGVCSEGTLYRVTFYWRHNGTGGDWSSSLSQDQVTLQLTSPIATVTSADTTYAQVDFYFIYQPEIRYLLFRENNASNDGGIYLDNLSVKEVTTACFGSELYADANALSTGAEADATTNITNTGCDNFDSVSTDSPADGTYHLLASESATPTAGARATIDLGTQASLQNGTKYFISFWIKHIGSGSTWSVGLNNDGNTNGSSEEINIASDDTTYKKFGWEFTYSSTTMRYFVVNEDTASNDGGVYLDGLSVKTISSR